MQGQTNAKIGKKAKLYDTRILETQEAEKGWLYTCSNNYRTFNSSTLPTLYNDINTKLQNSQIVNPINITDENILKTNKKQVLYCNNTFYQGGKYYNNGTWNNISDIPEIWSSVANSTGSLIIAVDENTAVYKINPLTNQYKKLADNSPLVDQDYYTLGSDVGFFRKEFDNIIYLTNGRNNYICSVNNNYTDNTFITYTFNKNICDLEYVNGYWYLFTQDPNTYYYELYKGNDLLNNDLTDTSKWQLVYTYSQSLEEIVQLFYYSGRFIICTDGSSSGATLKYFYSDDEFNTVSNIIEFDTGTDTPMRIYNNYLIYIGNNGNNNYGIHCCLINELNSIGNWKHLNIPTVEYSVCPLSYPINSIMYFFDKNNEIYSTYLNSNTFTDKYVVNNSIVSINYYKYENFKICQYNNLIDLNMIYNQYGISDYWNIYNNTISIPVNKQEYKVIYVGDNFEDNLYNN